MGGADIEWELLYRDTPRKKVSIPGYPFAGQSYWIEPEREFIAKKPARLKEMEHPLFERCLVQSFDRLMYVSLFDRQTSWLVNEHKVAGVCVVPGTAYIEMVIELLNLHYRGWTFQLQDVVLISPLVLHSDEAVEVHSVLKKEHNGLAFTIASKPPDGNDWTIHAEGKVRFLVQRDEGSLNVERLKQIYTESTLEVFEYEPGKGIETGARWNCIKETYFGINKVLARLAMQEVYTDEIKQYNLHPALLDEAVNILLRNIDKGLYLPFSYKSISVMGQLPGDIYSHVQRKDLDMTQHDVAAFDITLTDATGKKIVQIEDYMVKKVDEEKIGLAKNTSALCYTEIAWNEKQNTSNMKEIYDKDILVFKGEGNTNNDIIVALRRKGVKIIEIEIGNFFTILSEQELTIRPEEEDYMMVFQHIGTSNIGQILYMQTLSDKKETRTIKDLKEKQGKGVYGLLNLLKALGKSRLEKDVELILIAQYAHGIDQHQQAIIPENAALFGLGKAVHLEYPRIKCRSIDIDDHTRAEAIVAELHSAHQNSLIAYRDNHLFVPSLEPIRLHETRDHAFSLKEMGVYLITGGTGGLGLEVAKFLSSITCVHIALINRSPFPPSTQWEEIVKQGENTKLCNKISILKEIQQKGSNVAFYEADVSNVKRMKEVIKDISTRFGQINGVFHIAGNAGDGLIIQRDMKAFRNVLAPKIEGTWILDHIVQKKDLDFFVMFSSISSIIPEIGQADYTAANSYLDAYACYSRKKEARYITINWPAWTEVGMAVDYRVDLTKEVFVPINTNDAIQSLRFILQKDIRNVIVGNVNVDNYRSKDAPLLDFAPHWMAQIASRETTFPIHNAPGTDLAAHPVTLTGAKNGESYTKSEQQVATLIGNALGLMEVNINDGFLDVGGNSILAIKVAMDMGESGIPISLLDLYEYTTIKELAAFVATKQRKIYQVDDKPVTDPKMISKNGHREKHENIENSHISRYFVIDTIKPFNDIFYKTCFHNSLFPVLQHFHSNLALILANDLFLYNTFDIRKEPFANQMINISEKPISALLNDAGIAVRAQNHVCRSARDIVPSNEDIYLLKQFSKCIGMKSRKKRNDTTHLLNDIKKALLKSRPVILWVDCFYLSNRKDTYQREHWMHTLLIYGFDETQEVFFTIEHSFKENLTYKEHKLHFKDVIESYDAFIANYADYAEMPTFYEFYATHPPKMLHYRDIYTITIQKHKNEIMTGIEHMKGMADTIRDILRSESNLQENIDTLIITLNSIMNAKQIESYIITNLFDDARELGEINKWVMDIWIYVRQIIVKYKYSGVYDSKKIISAAQRITEAYPTELAYYRKLFATLSID